MGLRLKSPCKINLYLNILFKRDDGFHELESIFQPIPIFDEITVQKGDAGIQLTCNNPKLSAGSDNLVWKAAEAFMKKLKVKGVKIQLKKNLPLSAGIGAGSSNAAYTLRGLNELYDFPLGENELKQMAIDLGCDLPFFLQDGPAVVLGRGEKVEIERPFEALQGRGVLLIHPGFGVSTPWAYRLLNMSNETSGEERQIEAALDSLRKGKFSCLFNSFEKPIFEKHLILSVLKKFLLRHGAIGALMSGSGSTTFAVTEDVLVAESLRSKFHQEFGQAWWSEAVSL
ncbi:MAG: 4-(cytidine 5'-diphospho)-2-C-methyl-D-erythritol kinase [Verrucomicrobiales bacterium]|nr:4-(cytidine 5'-diphospho)-2-C-methyl-D-erythritol kinase [Verrucomicrobiales bacterium]